MSASAESTRRSRGDAGEYRLLHKYLRDRFADRLVLTFAQIEDLLGFPLPGPAWVQRDWWERLDEAGQHTTQSDAWTLADRTATVNLSARCVTFERDAAART